MYFDDFSLLIPVLYPFQGCHLWSPSTTTNGKSGAAQVDEKLELLEGATDRVVPAIWGFTFNRVV